MPWLAEHLHLRSAVNASQQIRRHRRQPPALARKLQKWMVQSINAGLLPKNSLLRTFFLLWVAHGFRAGVYEPVSPRAGFCFRQGVVVVLVSAILDRRDLKLPHIHEAFDAPDPPTLPLCGKAAMRRGTH
jgi:hypothetical protein